VSERTALINQLRALLIERGIIVPQGRRKLEQMLDSIIADESSGLSTRIRQLISGLRDEWKALDDHRGFRCRVLCSGAYR
jgi:transposase